MPEVFAPDPTAFRAEQQTVEVHGLTLCSWQVSAMKGIAPAVESTPEHVRIDLLTDGAVQFRFRDRVDVAEQGSAVLLPCWEPVAFAMPRPVRVLRLILSTGQLPDALIDGSAEAFGLIPGSRLLDGLTALADQTLTDAAHPSSPAASVLRELALAVIAELTASRLDLRNQMVLYIDTRLADPDLGPSTIAAAFGVSVRWVHQVFGSGGETLARHIRVRRCEEVAAELRRNAPPSADVLARRYGFRNADHLARVFRSERGASMRAYTRTHRPD